MSDEEKKRRQKYQFAISVKPVKQMLIIDAADEPPGGEIHYGRLANHARDFMHSNMKACARILQKVPTPKRRPVCVLVSTSFIENGSQLLYDYGRHYFSAGGPEFEWAKIKVAVLEMHHFLHKNMAKSIL